MNRYLAMLWLTLLPLLGNTQSNSATDELILALEDMHQLQGSFLQQQFSENDALLVESSGSFRLLRPGFFAWEIQVPDSQLVIATPEYVWHHDLDLDTVTRRPVSDSAQMSPLQVLGGDEAVLRERFSVAREEAGVFTLTPVKGDPGFQRLTLQLDGNTVTGMEILDKLNQRVVIAFDQLDAGAALTPADFAFQPPDGADLFYYDE